MYSPPPFGAALKYSLLKPQPQLTTDTFIEFIFVHYSTTEHSNVREGGGFSLGVHEPPGVIKGTYNFFIVGKKTEDINLNFNKNQQNQTPTKDTKHAQSEQ